MNIRENGFWLALIGGMLLIGAVMSVLLFGGETKNTAEITLDGERIRTVDLYRDQSFTVKSQWGENTVVVENGTVRVEEASCPDHVCVKRGACSGGPPIVCLPNRLVISFTDSAAVDAAT